MRTEKNDGTFSLASNPVGNENRATFEYKAEELLLEPTL